MLESQDLLVSEVLMSKFNYAQNTFTGGQLSPKLQGRFDLQDYRNSVDKIENFLTYKAGGAYFRTGFLSYADITSTVTNPVLQGAGFQTIPFIFSKEVSYCVVVPQRQIALADSGIVTVYRNKENPFLTPSTVTTRRSNTIRGDWNLGQTQNLQGSWKYAQVGDRLLMCHSSGLQKPLVLSRTDEDVFVLEYATEVFTRNNGLALTLQAAFYPPNTEGILLTPSTSPNKLTSNLDFFDEGMVGSLIKLNSASQVTTAVLISNYVSPTEVDWVSYSGPSPNNAFGATDDWEIEGWSDFYGWPTSVTTYEQRSVWGGTINRPDTIWMSLVGNLFHLMANRYRQDLGSASDVTGFNYFGDVAITDPLSFSPSSNQVNAITWLAGSRVLLAGTLGSEYVAQGYNQLLSNESIDIKQNTYYGGSTNQVIHAGRDVIFVGRDGISLRSYRFSDENGSYISDDLTTKGDGILWDVPQESVGNNIQITQLSWQPDKNIIWVVTSNFKLFSLTYDTEFGVIAWASHDVSGEVYSVICLPHVSGINDEVVIVVKRDLGVFQNRYFIEKMIDDYENTTMFPSTSFFGDIRDVPRFLDGSTVFTSYSSELLVPGPGLVPDSGFVNMGVTYADTVMTIFNWLKPSGSNEFRFEVREVTVGSDGFIRGLINEGDVVVGFPYKGIIKTLKIEAGGQFGTAQGQIVRIDKAILRLYKSYGFKIGSEEDRLNQVLFDDLVTQDHEVYTRDAPDLDGQLIIETDGPYPMNVIALIMRGVNYD